MMARSVRLFLWFLLGVGLSAFSVLSLAGESYTPSGAVSAFDACNNYVINFQVEPIYWDSACVKADSCPVSQNGGSCLSVYQRKYHMNWPNGTSMGQNTKNFQSLNSYCPDVTPKWDGAKCIKPEPCESKAGQFDNGGAPDIVQLSGPDAVYTGAAQAGKIPSKICIDKCEADPRAGYNFSGAVNKDGSYVLQGNPKYTGSSCGVGTPNPVPDYKTVPKNSPEYDCAKAGKGFGTVNGAVMCTDPTTPTEGKGKTSTATKDNSDGTKTETKTNSSVSCSGDGSCTTTTTTTTTTINSDGSRGATDTKTESTTKAGGGNGNGAGLDKSDPFCVQNPASPMCKEGAFSGSCSSGFTCDGDPAACASAKALQEHKCEQSKAAEALKDHADENLIKFDQAKADAALNKDGSKDLKLNEIWESKRQTYLSFANGCPVTERSFTLNGQTFTFDLSIVCTIGEFVKVLMHMAAYMFALRLFQRTVF
ncbi:MAG: hypothetical protein RBS35_03140 [Azonexus sp.]|jgi:hypothetical protein|nr:hypothetical protein [Azonexus sp.]